MAKIQKKLDPKKKVQVKKKAVSKSNVKSKAQVKKTTKKAVKASAPKKKTSAKPMITKSKKKAPVKKTIASKKAPLKTKSKPKAKMKATAKPKPKSKPKMKVAPKTKTKTKVTKNPVKSVAVQSKPKKVEKKAPAAKKALPKITEKSNMTNPNNKKTPIKSTEAPKKHHQDTETPSAAGSSTLIGSLNFGPYQLTSKEVYMNETQLEHFRKILLAWKEQLMQEADTTVEHMKEEAIFYPDILDRASQEEKFTLELRTRDRERKLIKKIEQALDAIDQHIYGYCEDCGAEIGIRRLEARPTAVKCIDCKTYEEIREKQVGVG